MLRRMTRKLCNFLIDADLAHGLKAVKERDGIAESEQIRRALRNYLKDKGVLTTVAGTRTRVRKAGRKREA